MAAKRDPVQRAAEELYGLRPAEFTRARDERAKELRKSGDREAADGVKNLRKPTVAAWALNQLARQRGKELGRLLSAGEGLRAAQAKLLAGGDRSTFQKAAAAERALVAELTGATREIVSEAGERAGAGLDEKVSATLHAAALDADTAEELRDGRLTREREAIGGFGGLTAGGAPSPPKPRQPKRQKAASKESAADARRQQRLAAARTDERHARRELEAAAKALESARTRAEAAEAHAADALDRAKVAAERLKEARRTHSAAKKAHARAERSLGSAEGG
ncbi:MAG TPA: hypothetical protein VFM57_12385 [Thermoleophilaceae bacterium]|nr:hypothetical protein [Thermoleophilaceae bacterium]